MGKLRETGWGVKELFLIVPVFALLFAQKTPSFF